MHFYNLREMNFDFSIYQEEGNQIKVSLRSFSDESTKELSNILKDTELIDITLERTGNGTIKLKLFTEIIERLYTIFQQNKNAIFYYYCDEIHEIPQMRKTKALSPAEYRNKLFSLLYQKGAARHNDIQIIDREIIIESDEGKAFIHLLYISELEHKAKAIEDKLIEISEAIK